MGSIDRWARNQKAQELKKENRRRHLDRAREQWSEAQQAPTRQIALDKIAEMRLILRVGELFPVDIDVTEKAIEDLLRSKT